MKKLFIVIPIYNVAKYLQECLDSVLAQTYKEFVAILVDDGSTDESASIAQSYCDKDTRFVLLRQANQGVGAARNTGIDYAVSIDDGGGYLGFIDPDDVIAKDYYANLIYALESHNVSIAKSGDTMRFSDDDYDKAIFETTQPKSKGKIQHITNKTIASKIEPWHSVFELSKLGDLRNPNVRITEDLCFGVCLNALFGKVAIAKNARYFYRNRAGSVRKQLRPPKDYIDGFVMVYEFFKKHNFLDKYTLPENLIAKDMSYLVAYPSYLQDFQETLRFLNPPQSFYKRNPLLKKLLDSATCEEFARKCISGKRRFRFHLNRNRIEIILFGKVLVRKDRD